jgi:virginiamycin B lyase
MPGNRRCREPEPLPHAVIRDLHLLGELRFWRLGTTISRADLNGTHVGARFITGAAGPLGVAVHDGYLYWSDPGQFGVCEGSSIGRATVSGSHPKQDFIGGVTCPQDIAISGNDLYWASRDTGNSVGRAELNGKLVKQRFIIGAAAPAGLTIATVK